MKRALWKILLRLLPARWRLATHYWRRRITGYVEPEMVLIRRWKNKQGRAVDIGANEGTYSFEMARWFRKVEAFEPNDNISTHVRAYDPSRVTLHSVALSSSTGKAKFHVPISGGGVPLIGWGTLQPELLVDSPYFSKAPHFQEFPIVTRTLDSYAFEDVAFIKIDVEGHEEEVLKGCRETLRRCRPVVLTEIKFAARAAVEEFFAVLDYRMFFLRANELHEVAGGAGKVEDMQENFFAIPSEKAAAGAS
jgi:FkbM family methyltransferase